MFGFGKGKSNKRDAVQTSPALLALCGDDNAARTQVISDARIPTTQRNKQNAKEPRKTRAERKFDKIQSIIVNAPGEQVDINREITVKSGFLSTETRTIFGHLAKNWADLTTSTTINDETKRWDKKDQAGLMQKLVSELGADPYKRKESGKYMFEYFLESDTPREVINAVIFAPTTEEIKPKDFTQIIERVSSLTGNPAQKNDIITALRVRQLQEAIKANDKDLVKLCLAELPHDMLQSTLIQTLQNPYVETNKNIMELTESPDAQREADAVIFKLTGKSPQELAREEIIELSERTGISQEEAATLLAETKSVSIDTDISTLVRNEFNKIQGKPLEKAISNFEKESATTDAISDILTSPVGSVSDSSKSEEEELEDLMAEFDLDENDPAPQRTQPQRDSFSTEDISYEDLEAEFARMEAEEMAQNMEQKLDKLEPRQNHEFDTHITNATQRLNSAGSFREWFDRDDITPDKTQEQEKPLTSKWRSLVTKRENDGPNKGEGFDR